MLSSSRGLKLQISTVVFPSQRHVIAHTSRLDTTFHTVSLGARSDVAYVRARADVKQANAAIVSFCNEILLVELQRRDGRVMSRDSCMYAQVLQRERQHAPIRPARHEYVWCQLQRVHQRSVTLQYRGTMSVEQASA